MGLDISLKDNLPNILTPTENINIQYPIFEKYLMEQLDCFWRGEEIVLEKDKQDLLTKMSKAELHGLTTTLKLFTKYELKIGKNYWANKIMTTFPILEIQKMAIAFAHVEYNSHAKFYNEVNVVLGLNTQEFYESWMSDPVLVSRIKFIDDAIKSENLPLSIAAFALVEGAILYSNFAYLKHYQQSGKNLVRNLISGIDQSVIDENIHHKAGCALFRILVGELNLSLDDKKFLEDQICKLGYAIYEHEEKIIEQIMSGGDIEGITETQLKNFVKSRINACISNLGLNNKLFVVTYDPISDWFYDSIGGFQSFDFFNIVGREYQRNWNESKFVW